LDGNVVDLFGGVYGASDVPFIDFHNPPPYISIVSPNHFAAYDGVTYSLGSLTVSRIPEPATYALMLAGLGVLSFVARRRNKFKERAAA
jgi:hypothetical protein